MKKIGLYIILLIGLSSCGNFEEISLEGEPDVKVESLKDGDITLLISARIHNPNHRSFTVKGAVFDIKLNGTEMGKAVMKENIKIEANSTKVYEFPVHSDIQAGKMGLSFLLGGIFSSTMTLSVEGKVKAGGLFLTQQFPVEWEDEISF